MVNNGLLQIELIDDTSTIDVKLEDNTENIDVSLTDYNDKGVKQDIEELKQNKVDKIEGKGLSTNDYTNNDKNKLDSLENYDDSEVRALIDTKQPRGDYALKSEIPDVSEYVKDSNYVHTDNNYTNNEKNKLNGIEEGAEVNVQVDWNETNLSSDAYIKNKPTLSTVATTGNYNDLINKPDFVLTTAERIRSIFG